MASKFGTWWQKIKQHPFITVGIVATIFALSIFTFAVFKFGWDWTGFTGGESKITVTSTSNGITTATELQPGKSLWDWLGLLATLAIPVVGPELRKNRCSRKVDKRGTVLQAELENRLSYRSSWIIGAVFGGITVPTVPITRLICVQLRR